MKNVALNITVTGLEELTESLARFAIAMGEPVDDVASKYRRDWSAHERLTLHQQSEQMQTVWTAIRSRHPKGPA